MTDYYGSPRWSGEIMDCSMPVTFDQYSNCSFGCIYCALRGTKIRMADGTDKPIEEIDVGDSVLSFNVETRKQEPDAVAAFMARSVESILEIELEDGTKISLTGEHPVFVEGKGWIRADDLQPEDEIISIDKGQPKAHN